MTEKMEEKKSGRDTLTELADNAHLMRIAGQMEQAARNGQYSIAVRLQHGPRVYALVVAELEDDGFTVTTTTTKEGQDLLISWEPRKEG